MMPGISKATGICRNSLQAPSKVKLFESGAARHVNFATRVSLLNHDIRGVDQTLEHSASAVSTQSFGGGYHAN